MGMGRNVFVATSLVDLYAKCGSMEKGGGVFDGMVEKDVVSWSAMIGGYASNGLPNEALELFFRMQGENVKPDCFTVVGVLSACASLGALELGDQLADKNHDVQLADFIESEFLGEQVVESIKKISECLAQLRRIGQGHNIRHFGLFGRSLSF